jgi:ATP-dependent DNA helicase RecG
MSLEGQLVDQKSLRAVTGRNINWDEIVKDCVAFANASGGRLLLGIEDGQDVPPEGQQVPADLTDTLRRKVAERTSNVAALPTVLTAINGGQFIELRILRSSAVASTTDGRYFMRVADQSKPVTGDDVLRLANERSTLPWETQTTLLIQRHELDTNKREKLLAALRISDRVKPSVKEKTDDELLDHYLLTQGSFLTNLGVLCLGRQQHRAQLSTSPVIQFIKYDEQDKKVNKLMWDDHTQSPMELIEAAWLEVPDFRERYELPDGLYRQRTYLHLTKLLYANCWSMRLYTDPIPSGAIFF